MNEINAIKTKLHIDRLTLKIIAVVAMFLDHLTILFPNASWLEIVGRLALPIFCYLVVEGYLYTSNLKKYFIRLILFAVISQIPFMLLVFKSLEWYGLNTLFALLIGLAVITVIDQSKKNKLLFVLTTIFTTVLGQRLAMSLNTDGNQVAIYMMVSFYLFRKNKLLQLVSMIMINGFLAFSMTIPISLPSIDIQVKRQVFAVFALIPIWLYDGKKGKLNKFIQYGFYAFYPIHMMLLWIMFQVILIVRL